jgi:hypothetical protein
MVAEKSMVHRQHRQDLLDVVEEAEVEHPVGFVEHQRADAGQLELLALGEVEEAAGGTDDDLDALVERLGLRLVRDAAVDRQHPDAPGPAGGRDVPGDLQAQLPGRYDDERLDASVSALGHGADPLQQRDAEAERLARTGGGLADQVGAAQGDGDRVLLDGERADDARLGERGHGLGAGAQLSEGGAVGSYGCGRGQRWGLGGWFLLVRCDLVRFDRHMCWGVLLPVRPADRSEGRLMECGAGHTRPVTQGAGPVAGRTRGAGALAPASGSMVPVPASSWKIPRAGGGNTSSRPIGGSRRFDLGQVG